MSTTKFVSPSAVGAEYFRPAEFLDAFAVVLEPKVIVKNGADGKPEVLCSAFIWDTEDDLRAGLPPRVIRDTVVNVGIIYRQLVRAHDQGAVLAGYIDQRDQTGFGTKPWVVEDLEPEVQELVVKHWNNLEVAA